MTNLEFDASITRYAPQNAFRLGAAANLAYQDADEIEETAESWGFGNFRFFDREETEAFLVHDDRAIILSFRGTEPTHLQDLLADAKLLLTDGPFGQVHRGFLAALEAVWPQIDAEIRRVKDEARERVETTGQGEVPTLFVTGHSLGAALATLAVAKLRVEDRPVHGLYTFGQPRTGDRAFAREFNADFKSQTFRHVNNNDVVTRVPPRTFQYSHVGTLRYFDVNGDIHEDIGWWNRFLDRVRGRLEDLGDLGTDGLKDHDMARYMKGLEKALSS